MSVTELAAMTWPEVPQSSLLVVPTGSCEQHGPHLPFDTDTLLARSYAGALAARRDDVVVAPAVAVGASGEHQSFPGTLSIGTEAMRDVAVELGRSALPPAGSVRPRPFAAVLFVNGHGGNLEALAAAERLLLGEGRTVAVWHPRVSGGDPHAGHTETSLMLHLHPDRVRTQLVEPGSDARFRDIADRLRTEGLAAVTPNGVLGDPTGATAEEGARLFAALVDDLVAAAADLLPHPPAGSSH